MTIIYTCVCERNCCEIPLGMEIYNNKYAIRCSNCFSFCDHLKDLHLSDEQGRIITRDNGMSDHDFKIRDEFKNDMIEQYKKYFPVKMENVYIERNGVKTLVTQIRRNMTNNFTPIY